MVVQQRADRISGLPDLVVRRQPLALHPGSVRRGRGPLLRRRRERGWQSDVQRAACRRGRVGGTAAGAVSPVRGQGKWRLLVGGGQCCCKS